MSYNFEEFEKDKLTRPRDIAWTNWFKFNNIGDKVQGYIVDVFYRKPEGEFRAQRGLTLRQPDGELVNVAIKRIPFILAQTDNLRIGDPLTIVYAEQLEPKQKGYKGAKRYEFYAPVPTEEKNGKTVKQLDDEDRLAQGVEEEVTEEEEELALE